MYERFLILLDETGITPYRVSKETGISQATLTCWKQGKGIKPLTTKLIADYFGVNVEWLAGETDVRENKKPADQEISRREREFMQLFDRLTPEQQDMVLAQLRGVVGSQGK